MRLEIDKIKRILIFKLCCLGDIVMLTPVINSLKENFPESEITLVVCSWVKGITKYIGNASSVIISDELYEKSKIKKLFGAVKLVFTLRKNSYDMAFLGHRNNIFGWILKLSGIKYRLGFCETKFINYCEPFDENSHEVIRYLNILKSIDISPELKPLELTKKYSPEEIKSKYKIEEGKFIFGIFPFGGINPGTGMNVKRWELKNYYSLIDKINREFPDSIIILFEGSEEDEKITGKEFEKNILKFKIDFDLISICNVMVSGDTGAMHIAAGFNVPTLSIFGPTDPRLLAPLNTSHDGKVIHRYIWKKPVCSPCYTPATAIDKKNKKYWRDGNFICHTGTHICMKQISTEEVFIELNEIVNKIKK